MNCLDVSRISSRSWLGHVLRIPLRAIPKNAVLPILKGPSRGCRWIVGSATHGAWLGTYESRKAAAFAARLERGAVAYDIGAHVGYYSLIASRRVGPSGCVLAFEPLPRNLEFLERHLILNCARNVRVIAAAVADVRGERVFKYPNDASACQGRLDLAGRLRVPTMRLDDMLTDGAFRAPDVIKMDIEGGELRALDGARQLLARFRPTVFLATHSPELHRSCCALLSSLGYRVRSVEPGADPAQTDEIVAVA